MNLRCFPVHDALLPFALLFTYIKTKQKNAKDKQANGTMANLNDAPATHVTHSLPLAT